jgi:uncharacterized protein YndB with AHSA1/START domain
MNTHNFIATAKTTILAPVDKVWEALVTPEIIKKYMFGTTVKSDWKEGSPITWSGEWNEKSYTDKGVILQFKPGTRLQYSHFSPLSLLPDEPENYHIVTIDLTEKDGQTTVSLSQDKNESGQAKEHSEENWNTMLTGLKKLLEEND